MIRFKEENIKYMALELPDEINFYKYSGDFDGEIAAIRRYLEKHDVTEGMKIRLALEEVIADGMTKTIFTTLTGCFRACVKSTRRAAPPILKRSSTWGMPTTYTAAA